VGSNETEVLQRIIAFKEGLKEKVIESAKDMDK
jgi:hypothetical protein